MVREKLSSNGGENKFNFFRIFSGFTRSWTYEKKRVHNWNENRINMEGSLNYCNKQPLINAAGPGHTAQHRQNGKFFRLQTRRDEVRPTYMKKYSKRAQYNFTQKFTTIISLTPRRRLLRVSKQIFNNSLVFSQTKVGFWCVSHFLKVPHQPSWAAHMSCINIISTQSGKVNSLSSLSSAHLISILFRRRRESSSFGLQTGV